MNLIALLIVGMATEMTQLVLVVVLTMNAASFCHAIIVQSTRYAI